MNLLILKPDEVGSDGRAEIDGRRARHIREVLRGGEGQTVRMGILNGSRGLAMIERVSADRVVLRCCPPSDRVVEEESRVDLLMAVPRPKVLKRIYAQAAAMGVRRVFLTNAEKVERCYFDTHWLQEEHVEPLLIEGLEQSGGTRLPLVTVHRRLKPLLEDELDACAGGGLRLVAQPGHAVALAQFRAEARERVLLAIGPEGGWTGYEIELLERHGFRCAGMGWRTLRADTACMAALSIVHAVVLGDAGAMRGPQGVNLHDD